MEGSPNTKVEKVNETNPEQVAINKISKSLQLGDTELAMGLIETFKVPEETIKEIVENQISKSLTYADTKLAKELAEAFKVPEETIKKISQEVFMKLPCDDIGYVLEIKKAFNLQDDICNSPEIWEKVKETMVSYFLSENLSLSLRLKNGFNLPEEVFNQAIKEGVRHYVSSYEKKYSDVLRIREMFNPSERVVQQAIAEGIADTIVSRGTLDVDDIIKELIVPKETVQEAVAKAVPILLLRGDILLAAEAKNAFEVEEDLMKKTAQQVLLDDASVGFSGETIKAFNISEDFLKSEQMQQSSYQAILKILSYGEVGRAIKAIKSLRLSESLVRKLPNSESLLVVPCVLPEKHWGNIKDFAQALSDFRNQTEEDVVGHFNYEAIEIGKNEEIDVDGIVRRFDKFKKEKYSVSE